MDPTDNILVGWELLTQLNTEEYLPVIVIGMKAGQGRIAVLPEFIEYVASNAAHRVQLQHLLDHLIDLTKPPDDRHRCDKAKLYFSGGEPGG